MEDTFLECGDIVLQTVLSTTTPTENVSRLTVRVLENCACSLSSITTGSTGVAPGLETGSGVQHWSMTTLRSMVTAGDGARNDARRRRRKCTYVKD